jgi:hypothetical protein
MKNAIFSGYDRTSNDVDPDTDGVSSRRNDAAILSVS